jgi:tRNA U34 5-methylaminomethyl-2-thiouridine-forming methyltransferase MnmC
MNDIELIVTGDGSHSLLNKAINETYHSRHGAVQESLHVFIRNGFEYVIDSGIKQVNIFEVGFGTGLNAWLTLDSARARKFKVMYHAIETYPLSETVWQSLQYTDDEAFRAIHRALCDVPVVIAPQFTLFKRKQSLLHLTLDDEQFDLIFYDAFAPEKQPEMWTAGVLAKVARWLKKGGVLVTYCAKGQVKRDLRLAGLTVETLKGPPGKREMIRAHKGEWRS